MHLHLLWPEEGLEAKVFQGTTMGTAESGLQLSSACVLPELPPPNNISNTLRAIESCECASTQHISYSTQGSPTLNPT